DKYKGEVVSKNEAITLAKMEKNQADIVLKQHELRNRLPGKSVIKKIYKSLGDGIKAQEPVLQLQNISRLRVEGSGESASVPALLANRTARCCLEPSVEMGPGLELMKAHSGGVTAVAFCADGEHFVSGSEDRTVRVWRRDQPVHVKTLRHNAAVRALACSPKGALVLVGCADGSLGVWDRSKPAPEPVLFPPQHSHPGAVPALAFSPDGAYIASGGEDNAIRLWEAGGKLLYLFDADHGVEDPHQGTVTALHFTPQGKLVSAARDNTLRVWALHRNGAKLAFEPVGNRGGTVSRLGVSRDG